MKSYSDRQHIVGVNIFIMKNHFIIHNFIYVGTLRQEYPLLQYKDEGAQERQPRTTGPDPCGQVPNLRGLDLGLYKWKPDLQEA